MGASLSNVLPHLREHYDDTVVDIFNVGDEESKTIPLMMSLEQRSMDDAYGRGFIIPITTGLPTSVSHTFTTANTKAQGATTGSTASRARWVVQAVTLEGVATVTRDAIDGARDDDDLFDILERQFNDETLAMRKRIAAELPQAGWGTVGGTISGITASTITLPPSVVNRLDIGMDLVASLPSPPQALKSNTARQVTQIAPETGVVTLDGDPTALGWANGDIVYFAGDTQSTAGAAATDRIAITGIGEYVPAVAPTTALFSVTRTGVQAVAGLRFNATGLDHATAFIQAANHLFVHGNTAADVCFCSGYDYAVLCADKESVKSVQIELGKYNIGFEGVSVMTLFGPMPIVPDSTMQQGQAWMGPFKNKRYAPFLVHTGSLINLDDKDGNQMLRQASATSYDQRLYSRINLAFPAPGKFETVFNLPAA